LFGIPKKGVILHQQITTTMENIAKSLENKTILVVNATTRVNSVSKKSRITNQLIALGSIVFERNDGVFFGPLNFLDSEWRAFYRFENNTIEIDQFKKPQSKSITIKEFKVI
jgi:hypothetical protein